MVEPKVFRMERWLIPVLCAIAAIRVFVFAAAFPFFSNIDESAQLDVVVKYSHFEIPRSFSSVSPESATYLSIFGTPEYSSKAKLTSPMWTRPLAIAGRIVKEREIWWRKHLNYEVLEPPLYYSLAGSWLSVGRACGFEGGLALYWIRFLNIGLAAALVWLAFESVKTIFPDRLFLRIGVPFLVALWPQDAFYSIQSDVLSPICFGFAFIALLRMLSNKDPSPWPAVFAGLGLAATFLVKVNNFGLVAVALGAVAVRAWRWWREGRLRLYVPVIVLFFAAAAVPVTIWCIRNYYIAGDLTASSAKVHFLGWTPKPIGAWWNHPIFTAGGLWTFWSDLLASFWRGEFIWHGERLSFRSVDLFYAISSALFIGSAAVGMLQRKRGPSDFQRQCLGLALFSFAAALISLAMLSIIFDFGQCLFPSRSYPFFASGRLLSGAVIPIMLLYVYGLDTALRFIGGGWVRYFALGGIGLFITASEVILSTPIFSSPYNFFHM